MVVVKFTIDNEKEINSLEKPYESLCVSNARRRGKLDFSDLALLMKLASEQYDEYDNTRGCDELLE